MEFHVNAPTQVKVRHWGDYARGAKYALQKRFELKRGITGVIQGSLPVGGLVVIGSGADCLCDGICESEQYYFGSV